MVLFSEEKDCVFITSKGSDVPKSNCRSGSYRPVEKGQVCFRKISEQHQESVDLKTGYRLPKINIWIGTLVPSIREKV